MKDDLNNIINNMSKEELINFYNDIDIEVKEVEPNKGGWYLHGKDIGKFDPNIHLNNIKNKNEFDSLINHYINNGNNSDNSLKNIIK